MATEEKKSKIELTELEPDQDQPEEGSKDVKGGAIFTTAIRRTTSPTITSPTTAPTPEPDDLNPFFKN